MKLKVEIYRSKDGEYFWHAMASNGKIVADGGEGYKRKSDCVRMAHKIFPTDKVNDIAFSFVTVSYRA